MPQRTVSVSVRNCNDDSRYRVSGRDSRRAFVTRDVPLPHPRAVRPRAAILREMDRTIGASIYNGAVLAPAERQLPSLARRTARQPREQVGRADLRLEMRARRSARFGTDSPWLCQSPSLIVFGA